MRLKILQFFVFIFFSLSAFGQSLGKKELSQLQGTIFDFLSSQDDNTKPGRPSEFVLCFLEIDSNGKVCSIQLLGDDRNKDTTYSILSRLTPVLFKSWKAENCKGKSIMLPIINIAPGKGPDYIEGLMELYSVRPYIIKNLALITETNKIIVLSAFEFAAPTGGFHQAEENIGRSQ